LAKVFVEDAEAKAGQWGAEKQFQGDPKHAKQTPILASFNAQCYYRIQEKVLEETNAANLEHSVQISRERAATKEACRLLMPAEPHRLLELHAQRLVETAHEEARLEQTEETYRMGGGRV
jgi:hypothetical protein